MIKCDDNMRNRYKWNKNKRWRQVKQSPDSKYTMTTLTMTTPMSNLVFALNSS